MGDQLGQPRPVNYVLLSKGTNINAFNKKVAGVITFNTGDTARLVSATRFSDIYLQDTKGTYTNGAGRAEFVRLFSILAIFILVIACINFMNLSTAKAS
ncbi:MAG TPA: hypothetical protein VK616_10120, partial [Flavitalea sp.]|nr:hypothetical protein [Flavitalea sp.]